MDLRDPYFDERIGDLRNLLGAQSSEELQEREPQIVFANELELESAGIARTNDLTELLAVHRQLFKNVYDWAGIIRTVDIKKDSSSDYFLPVSKINDASQYIFRKLAQENYLSGLGKADFSNRIAYFYDQLNYIHPFREGNGRTQRIFWSRVSRDAGYEINWDAVIGDQNNEASRIAAESMNLSKLEDMFRKITILLDDE